MTVRIKLVLGICAALCYGCIIPSQEALRNPSISDQSRSEAKPSGTNKGLIKPYIPSERDPATQTVAEQQSAASFSPETSAPIAKIPEKTESSEAPVVTPAVSAANSSTQAKDRKWEDQKVKAAAMELSSAMPGIKKLKVCYAVKEDEWWVTLYEESGASFELKQFTWNREQDKLEQFLVQKRLAADRLQSHLTEHENDMACEVLDPSPSAR